MIISASYKTDIPAFYGEWFRKRMEAGYCKMVNPYGGQVYTIPLDPKSVEAFVFWTRDIEPFWDNLPRLNKTGYPFMVQYTVTGYPKELEGSVPGAGHSVEMIRKLAAQFGPRCVVWRYDPVLFSSLTPPAFHLKNFKALCHDLKGAVDEVVVSFTQAYRKTRRNLDKLGEGFAWEDPAPEGKKEFLAELVPLAAKAGMKVSLCAQRDLGVPGSRDASCVDAARLSQIAGKPVGAKGKGHRPDCGCAPSKDIGSYDTCPFGCVYCYATQSRKAARARMEKHDPDLEFLK